METKFPYSVDEVLLAKYFVQETDDVENQAILQWLDAKEENRQFYRQLKKVWEGVELARDSQPVDIDRAWQQFKNKLNTKPSTGGKFVNFPGSTFKVWYVAASIALLFCIALTYLFLFQQNDPARMLSFSAKDQTRVLYMPDSSKVTLNRNSRIDFPSKFAGKNREISLEGEAFFEVKPNPGKAFIVKAGKVEVKVLGTSFNVRSYKNQLEIVVVVKEGKVAVAAPRKEVVLEKNGKAIFDKSKEELQKSVNQDKNYLSYQNLVFVFEQTPLKEVVARLNADYQADIRLANQEIGECQLTVTFENESLTKILEIIGETLSLKVVHQDRFFTLDGKGCEISD